MPMLLPQTRGRLGLLIVIACAASLAMAQVKIICLHPSVKAGGQLRLRAEDPRRVDVPWHWQVIDAGGGTVTPVAGQPGLATYNAPALAGAAWFLVRVTDPDNPGNQAQKTVFVRPEIPGMSEVLLDQVLPSVLGDRWMHPGPWITPFPLAGPMGAPPPHPDDPPNPFTRIRFAGSAAARRMDPDWHWLACGSEGLSSIDHGGRITRLWSEREVNAFAIRPQDSLPGNPLNTVFADPDPAGDVVRILNLDGTTRVLAGSRRRAGHREEAPQDGLGDRATFARITDMTMTRAGEVLVVDDGCVIRRITPAGQVTTLAGQYTPLFFDDPEVIAEPEGRARAARFPGIRAMALDHATGDLYVLEGARIVGDQVRLAPGGIRRVTPQGEVRRIEPSNPSPAAAAARAGASPSGNAARLSPWLLDAQVRGRTLVIGDGSNFSLLFLDLDTRRLTRGVGDKSQMATRDGPPAFLHPDVPTAQGAALGYPVTFDFSPDGFAMVVTGAETCCEVDLSELPGAPSPAAPAERRREAPQGRPGQGPEEKKHAPARPGQGEAEKGLRGCLQKGRPPLRAA